MDTSRTSRASGVRALLVAAVALALIGGCKTKVGEEHREAAPSRDGECREPSRPRAFFYPAANRTDYGPDDPKRDGCALLVADHLFCCPAAHRPTDR